MQDLIDGLLKIVKYIKTERGQAMNEGIPKFSVASTFNLRTFMGFGLPSKERTGPIHGAINSFVTSTLLGEFMHFFILSSINIQIILFTVFLMTSLS